MRTNAAREAYYLDRERLDKHYCNIYYGADWFHWWMFRAFARRYAYG